MTLGKFHKRLTDGAFAGIDGVSEIRATYNVSWRRIDFAIPKDHIQPMWDGYLRQLARQQNVEENTGPSANFGYLIIAGGVVVSLGMLAIKFLS